MTKTSDPNLPLDRYWQYLRQRHLILDDRLIDRFTTALHATNWDEPESAIELNNFAVLSLIEAEQSDDINMRTMHLEIAAAALTQGVELQEHPLCAAHLALIHQIMGETQIATRLAFTRLVNSFQSAHVATVPLSLGLVYLPPTAQVTDNDLLRHFLEAGDGYAQSDRLLTTVLCRAQIAFYNLNALRFLNLSAQLMPDSAQVNLQLGLSQLNNQNWEGMFNLQRAREIAPDRAEILQALYLAYRPQQPDIAEFWRKTAQEYRQQQELRQEAIAWQWTELDINTPFTYVSFDGLLLAVEPNLNSKVTSVLLAAGDWFEAEMEFWRTQIQPGMTVIDVGANAGVYSFSAAQRVGQQGRVLAIEPFSACIQYLRETCRVNQFSSVTICEGAASDRNGSARLALYDASEQNELVSSAAPTSGQFEEVICFSLDHLLEQEQLDRVDWLKIDAEGHEIQVLLGSDRLLQQFAPGILYENIAGESQSNLPVAEFLQSKGYSLFRYRPYVQQLLPIDSLEALEGNLNIIALPI
jgi:FkbM family methyltransferase